MKSEELKKINKLSESTLHEFYAEYSEALNSGETFNQALLYACYNSKGIKVFKLELDIPWFVGNEVTAYNALLTFEGFKRLIDKGYIEIRPYNKSTEDENIIKL